MESAKSCLTIHVKGKFIFYPSVNSKLQYMYIANGPLLDKVACVVIGDFQMDQHHLVFKVSLKSST